MSKIVIRPNKGRLHLKSFFLIASQQLFFWIATPQAARNDVCGRIASQPLFLSALFIVFLPQLAGKNYVHNRQKKYFCLLRS
jgi:hypothetical protein